MTMKDCPRCHGGKYTPGKGFVAGVMENLTLRRVNVMASTQMIHYTCNNCGYTERVPYIGEEEFPEKSPERIALLKGESLQRVIAKGQSTLF